MPIQAQQKLTLLYRVEPGCLGPQGKQHIDAFCQFAQQQLHAPDFAIYQFVPRHDKRLPEISYFIAQKRLDTKHVTRYLQHFNQQLTEFENQLEEALAEAIEAYFQR